ncbi:MAG: hypothetical protein LBQ66_11870, partial [Planctomycetaceae bacterium]|nr:hypothetical protein [Planctomycetaceae bacterium]
MEGTPRRVGEHSPNRLGVQFKLFWFYYTQRRAGCLVIPHIFSGLSFIFTLIPCIVVLACSVWIGTTPE